MSLLLLGAMLTWLLLLLLLLLLGHSIHHLLANPPRVSTSLTRKDFCEYSLGVDSRLQLVLRIWLAILCCAVAVRAKDKAFLNVSIRAPTHCETLTVGIYTPQELPQNHTRARGYAHTYAKAQQGAPPHSRARTDISSIVCRV